VQLHADCAFYKRKAPDTIKCTGEVRNFSSGGCLLTLLKPHGVEVNMMADLAIDWPVALQEDIALRFLVRGLVLRVDGDQIAVTIRSYRFRVFARQSQGIPLAVHRRSLPSVEPVSDETQQ
jgi:hypothetical protein